MSKAPELVPSVEEYVNAFKKIESQMTDKQKEMLVAHYERYCHVVTARDLAFLVEYEDFEATNLWYGKLVVCQN